MNPTLERVLAITCLILGEMLVVFATTSAANAMHNSSPFAATLLRFVVPQFLGAAALLSGYMLGIRAFQSIWTVTVISVATVIIFEPVFGFLIFRTMPHKGALIGLVLGILGMVATLWE